MLKNKFLVFMCLVLAMAVVAWSSGDALAQGKGPKPEPGKPVTKDDQAKYLGKITPSELKAAAKAARARGVKPGKAGTGLAAATPLPAPEGPGGIPHYYGPYGNWAFSPLPMAQLNATVTVDAPGSGYVTPVVTITDAYDGTITDTSATVTLGVGGAIATITATPGTLFTAPVVTVTDLAVPGGTGALATATLDPATAVGGLVFIAFPETGVDLELGVGRCIRLDPLHGLLVGRAEKHRAGADLGGDKEASIDEQRQQTSRDEDFNPQRCGTKQELVQRSRQQCQEHGQK